MIEIIPYHNDHKDSITAFMNDIAAEFSEPMSIPGIKAPGLPPYYMVAIHNDKAIGTVGLDLLSGNNAVLRRMFVHAPFRGKEVNVSERLLQTALDKCYEENIGRLYLGTMQQFKSAQRFYTKHGFNLVAKEMLPPDFIPNVVDTLFYVLDLNKK